MLKTLLTSASLSLALLFLPVGSFGPVTTIGAAGLSPAGAIDIGIELGGDEDDGPTIGVGVGGGDDEDEGGDDDGDSADGDDDDDGGEKAISCQSGKRVVERAGYRSVRVRECTGKNYRYTGRKKGDSFEIVVSRFGRIVSVRRR
jgi:hypothetical protein